VRRVIWDGRAWAFVRSRHADRLYPRGRFVEVARHNLAGIAQSHRSGAILVVLPSVWKVVMSEEGAGDEGALR